MSWRLQKRNKVKKVIYASSSSLYNGLPRPYKESAIISPKTFYESSFYCRETVARTYNLEYGVDSVGLRYFSVCGPINSNNNDNNKEHGKKRGNNARSGFNIYNVGTGIQTSFNRVVEIINKKLGTDIKPTYVKTR